MFLHIHHIYIFKGDSERVASTLCCSSQWILGSVYSNRVEKCCNAPMWLQSGQWNRVGTVANRKLIPIHKQYNSYNKIKTVTKWYLCTNQDGLYRWQGYTIHAPVMRLFFKCSVWLTLSSPSLILNLLWYFFNCSFISHIHTTYTFTNPHRE